MEEWRSSKVEVKVLQVIKIEHIFRQSEKYIYNYRESLEMQEKGTGAARESEGTMEYSIQGIETQVKKGATG